jgi:hypothetical protein
MIDDPQPPPQPEVYPPPDEGDPPSPARIPEPYPPPDELDLPSPDPPAESDGLG